MKDGEFLCWQGYHRLSELSSLDIPPFILFNVFFKPAAGLPASGATGPMGRWVVRIASGINDLTE